MACSWIESKYETLGSVVGVPADQAKLLTCFLMSVLLGIIQHKYVHGAWQRHIYSITFGLLFGLFQFGLEGLVNFAFSSSVVYLMLMFIPREKVALPVFIFSLGFLSYVHIYRMVTDWMGWKMDASGLQMMLTCKLSSLAFCYQDGFTMKKKPEKVPPEQKTLIVDVLPSLLEYYSYLCFYPGFIIGPPFEFMEYLRYVREVGEYEKSPSTVKPALITLGKSLIFMVFLLLGDHYFPYQLCGSPEFYEYSLLYRLFYFNAAMFVCKIRYTTGWKFTEAGMTASGLGYAGKDKAGNDSWSRGVSIVYEKAELAWTAKEMIDNWNIPVSIWIRRYIYSRIIYESPNPSAKRRSFAQHSSFVISGFWHGFYPSYYIMFFWFSIHSEISKMVYSSNWSFLPFKDVLKWVAWGIEWQIGNCLGIIFVLLDFFLVYSFLKAIYFWPLLALTLGWLFFKVTGLHRQARKTKIQ